MKLKSLIAGIIALGLSVGQAHAATATLLPNGEQCYINSAGGTAGFYVPNTMTLKDTWFNADQAPAHKNTNPVTLDANGCAVVYGVGSYRQIVKDSLGNTVWDQVTTDTSANNNTFWAGLAAGLPNAITVTALGFNGTDGSVLQFVPFTSNTGPATLNPSGFGAISIVKDTTTGAVALSGGEIVAGSPSNVVNVVYNASQANFHILNLVNQSAAQTPQTLCGAIGLSITPDSVTPNTKINIAADQITMINASGQTISRTNVSLSINFTLNGANGLDIGALANNSFYNFWVIDNGSSAAGLGSLSATAPTMPSGYSYKCRLGAQRTDGATHFPSFFQLGSWTQNNGTASGAEFLAAGTLGSSCSGAAPVWATVAYVTSGIMPPTATEVRVYAVTSLNGGGPQNVQAAPNANYTGFSGAHPPPLFANGTGMSNVASATWVIEGPNFAVCSTGVGGALALLGWKDKVNAN